MREIFTSGSVGGAPGNRCFYLEIDHALYPLLCSKHLLQQISHPCCRVLTDLAFFFRQREE